MALPIIQPLENRVLFATVPAGFTVESAATGFDNPTSLVVLPDGRWLVTEKSGRLRVVANGVLQSTPALNISVDDISERGLLGVEIDPQFATNHFVYLYYTPNTSPKANRLSRFVLDGETVTPGSETVLMTLDPLSSAGNHNGGAMHTGPDGKLYVAVGENANPANAQSLQTVLGKILRINFDGSIPTDNPFYGSTTGNNRAIWAYGLRNPFTFAFHPSSGRMHINDVGQNTFEEINLGRAGANYGWPGSEGASDADGVDSPIYSYDHDVGEAITAGAFYAGATQQFPTAFKDDYFFGDYVAGWVKVRDSATGGVTAFADNLPSPVDLDMLPDGSVLCTSFSGTIFKFKFSPSQRIQISQQPADKSVALGQSATFTAEASAPSAISYQWYRNGIRILHATGSQYTTPAVTEADQNAVYSVKAFTATDSVVSRPAKLTVDVSNSAPAPAVTSPLISLRFAGGKTYQFAGSATDAQDGNIAASKLAWTIQYVTGSVKRPFETFVGVANGEFTVPRQTPFTTPDVVFRITLTATDSDGVRTSITQTMKPRLSTMTFASNVRGIPILIDGQPSAMPTSIAGVEGITRTIEAPANYILKHKRYRFVRFSDGGSRVRSLNTPVDDLNLFAEYAVELPSAQIVGYVVNDVDKDGSWTTADAALQGRTVWLDLDNDAKLDSSEPTALTNAKGKYAFAGLYSGTYVVRQSLPKGWLQSRPSGNASISVGLNPGATSSNTLFMTYRT